jgi:hypothetical protein
MRASRGLEWSCGYLLPAPRFGPPEAKAEAWSEGLGRMFGPLVDRGVEVVIVHTVPKFWGLDPRDGAALRLLLDAETYVISVDRAETDLLRERAIWAESTAASTSGRAPSTSLTCSVRGTYV